MAIGGWYAGGASGGGGRRVGVVPDVVRCARVMEATFSEGRMYSLLKGVLETMLGVRDGTGDVEVADRPVLLRCFFLRKPSNPILFE